MSLSVKIVQWLLTSLSFFVVIIWIRKMSGDEVWVDRRVKRFLSHYYSARIPVSFETFALVTVFAVTVIAVAVGRWFGHWLLGVLAGLILLGLVWQSVWSRSIEQNRKLDMELPYLIGLIRNSFLATNGNERFALEYAVNHVTMPAIRNPFQILLKRWEQGADFREEAEKTKRFFRNPLMGHLLDAVVQEHYGGGSFLQDLDRLADQARDRFRLAESRKVATAGSVYALYGVIALNLLLFLIVAVADPEGIKVFRDLGIGKLITGLSMIGYAGVLMLVFRLIRLGDD